MLSLKNRLIIGKKVKILFLHVGNEEGMVTKRRDLYKHADNTKEKHWNEHRSEIKWYFSFHVRDYFFHYVSPKVHSR